MPQGRVRARHKRQSSPSGRGGSLMSFRPNPLRALLAILLMLLATVGQAAGGPRVVLVTGERTAAHDETIGAIRSALAPELSATDIGLVEAQDFDGGGHAEARIIVTVGTQAAKAVGARRPAQPVLNTLLTRELYEAQPAPLPGQTRSAIFLDQPPRRQLALLNAALPDQGTVALLVGPNSDELARQFVASAGEYKLRVNVVQVSQEREIYQALEKLLRERSVLFALPDATVFNTYTIQNILLTSYRHRTPLIGFSPAYVRAGALLALYSTPAQIGRQAAAIVRNVLTGMALPPPQVPREFEVAANPVVARSLGIELDAPERIAERVRERENLKEPKP
ncbi:hypothetical protein AZKH_4023 [Azoarcus sp. KH32C]|nr:hypothetical protein AZKH_4023 [Azoarcus sp. KH32C]